MKWPGYFDHRNVELSFKEEELRVILAGLQALPKKGRDLQLVRSMIGILGVLVDRLGQRPPCPLCGETMEPVDLEKMECPGCLGRGPGNL